MIRVGTFEAQIRDVVEITMDAASMPVKIVLFMTNNVNAVNLDGFAYQDANQILIVNRYFQIRKIS